MKRYRFPLRSVAILRAHRELVAREALAAAVRTCTALEVRLNATQRRLTEMEQLRAACRSGHFRPADEVSFHYAYRLECASEAELLRQKGVAAAEAELRRIACVEANREVKAIERLEAAAIAAHRYDAFRAEQNEFDEIAGRRTSRRRAILS